MSPAGQQYILIPAQVANGDVAGWLREKLEVNKLSQRQLALITGLNHATISRLLQGRTPLLPTVVTLVKVLGP